VGADRSALSANWAGSPRHASTIPRPNPDTPRHTHPGNFGVLFDWWEQTSAASILTVPEIIWEAFLGIYCALWGFRKDSPILRPTWRGNSVA
jgi:hypothetical protein